MEKILVLDGAMGTMIQRYKLSEEDYRGHRFKDYLSPLKGNNDLLSLTKSDLIYEIHCKYLEAGADIIETNTFSSTSIAMADYHMEDLVTELNIESARLAVKAKNKYSTKDNPRYVAGAIGPTNKTASLSPDVNNPGMRSIKFDELVTAYEQQVHALYKGGVDFLLIETVFDTLNAKAALVAIDNVFTRLGKKSLPIMISGTITDQSGRTLSGQTIEAFLYSLSHFPLMSIGINCALGAQHMGPYIKRLAQTSPWPISIYPNAGLPNEFGQYDQGPKQMASILEEFLKEGLINIVGGCCGTTDEHIREIALMAEKYHPRKLPTLPKIPHYSGLEPLTIFEGSNFINIGERTNISGSTKFKKLIQDKDFEKALEVARNQVENGAQILDINMDDGMIDGKEAMVTFLNLVGAEPDIAKIPIMIDSSKWEIIEAGLKCVQGKCIVNSISLKGGEEEFISNARLVKKYGAAVVVMAFDETGQADTFERRIDICKRSYDILTKKVHFPPEDIIFDPNILAIATGIEEHNNYAVDFIKATSWIKSNLPYVKVSGGVSNISFSFRGHNAIREAIHSVFLYHAIKAGMDMGIVNPGMLEIYEEIEPKLRELTESVVLNTDKDATEKLLDYAGNLQSTQKSKGPDLSWRERSTQERINYALVRGVQDHIIKDIEELRLTGIAPLKIIETSLMEGMNIVGELFGEGKMFLPQVVKSARVMKKAVSHLKPFIEEDKDAHSKSSQGKILMATVKGDVHDIGKNIVSVVLACNNFEVIDMGVMVPAEDILSLAEKENVDLIGLSGLITPSLDEMIDLAALMEKKKMKKPLLIGGATTSKIHTAVKIDPVYSHTVIHVSDASKSVPVAQMLLSRPDEVKEKTKLQYQDLRTSYARSSQKIEFVPFEKAQKNRQVIDWDNSPIHRPEFLGVKKIDDITVTELIPYIDWTPFFNTWRLKGAYPKILEDKKYGEEARKLLKEARTYLKVIEQSSLIRPLVKIGFFNANSVDEDIIITTPREKTTLCMLRNQRKNKKSPNRSLSDYIRPISAGEDFIGAFIVTIGDGVKKLSLSYEQLGDDFAVIMIKALADRLAEALAEYMHKKVRTKYWGYSKEEDYSYNDLIKEKYQGIRPAPGYSACPDHTEKEKLFSLLDGDEIGVELTESFAMSPASSVCGWYFSHIESKYFNIGYIDNDQVENYAKRKGMDYTLMKKWLSPLIKE